MSPTEELLHKFFSSFVGVVSHGGELFIGVIGVEHNEMKIVTEGDPEIVNLSDLARMIDKG